MPMKSRIRLMMKGQIIVVGLCNVQARLVDNRGNHGIYAKQPSLYTSIRVLEG